MAAQSNAFITYYCSRLTLIPHSCLYSKYNWIIYYDGLSPFLLLNLHMYFYVVVCTCKK